MPKPRREHLVSLACLAVLVLGLAATSLASDDTRREGQGTPGSVIVVGIVEFQDESGLEGVRLGAAVARLLRQRLLSDHHDILPKPVAAPAASAAGMPSTPAELQGLGAQYGVRFVVLGGVLPVTVAPADAGTTTVVPLYAEVVSVDTGLTQAFRVEASVTASGSQPDTVESGDVASPAFARTPLGQAVANAVARLADEIHGGVVAPPAGGTPSAGEAPTPEPAGEAEPNPAPEGQAQGEPYDAGDLDAELQQIVANANDAIACYGNGDPALAGQLRANLEQLNRALSRKGELMASGTETQEVDASILSMAESVRSSTDALVQAGVARQGAAPPAGESAPPGEGGLAGADRLCGETLSLVQKIQELRGLLAGARQESESAGQAAPAAAGDLAGGGMGIEEGIESSSGSVTGVVVEDGQPVAGAEVTETSTGMTTTTGRDGAYVLGPLPSGLTGVVQVRRKGNVVATGRVPVLPTRLALADFRLGKKGGATLGQGVLGSTATASVAARDSGTLSGRVVDTLGRPAARVLVSVPGGGVVRTGSRGEFLMTGIRAGSYTLTAREPSLGEVTSPVSVRAGGSPTSVTLRLSQPAPSGHAPPQSLRLLRTGGAGARVHGRVRDGKDRNLPGVAVSLVSKEGTLTARTDGSGRYTIGNVRPGEYRLVAARAGFETATRGVSLKAKDVKEVGLKLPQQTPLVDTLRVATSSSHTATSSTSGSGKALAKPSSAGAGKSAPAAAKAPVVAPRIIPPAKVPPKPTLQDGALRGRVMDAKTRKPLAGATVSVSGGGGAVTDRQGAFRIAKVAPGTRDLNVSRPGYASDDRRVNVASGRTVTLELALHPVARPKPIRKE